MVVARIGVIRQGVFVIDTMLYHAILCYTEHVIDSHTVLDFLILSPMLSHAPYTPV